MNQADQDAIRAGKGALDQSRRVLDEIEARLEALDFRGAGELYAHEQKLAGMGVEGCKNLCVVKANEN